MNMWTRILHTTICFSLSSIVFSLPKPETNDNLHLWIEQKHTNNVCIINGTNYDTKERIFVSDLYIINGIILNTFLLFIIIPSMLFQYMFEPIEPINFNKLLYEININNVNAIQKSISTQSEQLCSQINKHEQEEHMDKSDLNSASNSDTTRDRCNYLNNVNENMNTFKIRKNESNEPANGNCLWGTFASLSISMGTSIMNYTNINTSNTNIITYKVISTE